MKSYSRTSPGTVVVASVVVVLASIPLVGLMAKVPWSRISGLVTDDATVNALRISMQTSLVAALLCALAGIPLAWVMSQRTSRRWSFARAVIAVPMILPPVVGGIALLASLGRRGVFGQVLFDWFGVSLPYTQSAVVVSQVFVALPFLVITAESAFRQIDLGVVDAARVMGCSPLRSFLTVVIPLARPSLVAGIVLAWARAIGEFGASITFAGSLSGKTQTVPMAVYSLLEQDWELAMLLSTTMVLLAVVIIFSLRKRLFGMPVS